jgi:hypothetical protein
MSYNSGVETLLNDGLNNQIKKYDYFNLNDEGSGFIEVAVNSISFSNAGTTPVILFGSSGDYEIPVGTTISFDAGGGDNRFPAHTFKYNSDGGILLIAYTY